MGVYQLAVKIYLLGVGHGVCSESFGVLQRYVTTLSRPQLYCWQRFL